jgi:hypothetical protein
MPNMSILGVEESAYGLFLSNPKFALQPFPHYKLSSNTMGSKKSGKVPGVMSSNKHAKLPEAMSKNKMGKLPDTTSAGAEWLSKLPQRKGPLKTTDDFSVGMVPRRKEIPYYRTFQRVTPFYTTNYSYPPVPAVPSQPVNPVPAYTQPSVAPPSSSSSATEKYHPLDAMSRKYPKPQNEATVEEMLAREPLPWSLNHWRKSTREPRVPPPPSKEEQAKAFKDAKQKLLHAQADLQKRRVKRK